jgi:hypothetical protein
LLYLPTAVADILDGFFDLVVRGAGFFSLIPDFVILIACHAGAFLLSASAGLFRHRVDTLLDCGVPSIPWPGLPE